MVDAYSRRPRFLKRAAHLEATVAGGNLRILSIDASKLCSLTVGELIHGCLGEVEAIGSVVNCQDVDGLAIVCNAVAGTALGRVPAGNSLVATDARERRDVALVLPAEPGDKTVGTVGAGENVQRAASIIVASVVGDCACKHYDFSRRT